MNTASADAEAAASLAKVIRELPFLPDRMVSPFVGGRRAALAALAKVDPVTYTRTRNFLDGAATRLSPYLRHGVLTLAEVRDHALRTVHRAEDAEKFVNELGWRDYWQRLYALLGEQVWRDREPIKTGHAATSYKQELPVEVKDGTTGLNCIDSFSRDLRETGYLHNHARMWMAAYTVHWLRVRWQAGARWFLEHLVDGDPASNNLSWQWVASTFSNKPYFFNRENLERYTNGVYCKRCPLRDGGCPLEASYEELEQKLFRPLGDQPTEGAAPPRESSPAKPSPKPPAGLTPLVWIHTDSLNPEVYGRLLGAKMPALGAAGNGSDAGAQRGSGSTPESGTGSTPESGAKIPAVFLWDEGWMREARISSKRAVFLEQCLDEMEQPGISLVRRKGELGRELLAEAKAVGAGYVVAQRTPDPRLLAAATEVERTLPVMWVDPPSFVDDSRAFDLKRFSRYWQKAQMSAMRPTP